MESPSPVFRFGPYELRPHLRELYKHGTKLKIRPQPLQVLHTLVGQAGEVITRDQLQRQLWSSETFVDFEHSLNTAMKELRGVLGDAAAEPRYIQTLPRLGYRFVAPVERVSAAAPAEVSAAPDRSAPPVTRQALKHTWQVLAGTALIAALSVYFAWSPLRSGVQTQRQIAGEVQAAAKGHLPVSPSVLPTSSAKSAAAHDLYLKGIYFWNKRTITGFQQAIENFQQATTMDPNYAAAYAGLANSYTLLTAYSSGSAGLYIPQARAAALRALELDEHSAEAHTALALILQNHDWDWQAAGKEYRRAIELNPDYATAHQWYAEHLMWLGRFDEALRESERARQLDPLSLIIATDQGAVLYFSRQYDRAIQQLGDVLRKDPNFPRACGLISYAYVEKGMFAQALAYAEAFRRLNGDGPMLWYWLGYIHGRAGHLEQARRELEKLERVGRRERIDPVTMLWAHLGMGDKEEALADLERAYAEHSDILVTLKVDPSLDPLRGDPRFENLLRRVGLTDTGSGSKPR